jgi:YD repeat-containing protein
VPIHLGWFADGTTHGISYGYDPAGSRTSMTDASGATSYTYDNDGRLTKVTNGAGQPISYGYNADSSITTVTYPNGKAITRGYDNAQRLTSVTDWNARLIDAGQPLVVLGESGTGKTYLLIGLGLAACEQSRRVRYAATARLVNELAEAVGNRQLSRPNWTWVETAIS